MVKVTLYMYPFVFKVETWQHLPPFVPGCVVRNMILISELGRLDSWDFPSTVPVNQYVVKKVTSEGPKEEIWDFEVCH